MMEEDNFVLFLTLMKVLLEDDVWVVFINVYLILFYQECLLKICVGFYQLPC